MLKRVSIILVSPWLQSPVLFELSPAEMLASPTGRQASALINTLASKFRNRITLNAEATITVVWYLGAKHDDFQETTEVQEKFLFEE